MAGVFADKEKRKKKKKKTDGEGHDSNQQVTQHSGIP
jgi:hypothetical protein